MVSFLFNQEYDLTRDPLPPILPGSSNSTISTIARFRNIYGHRVNLVFGTDSHFLTLILSSPSTLHHNFITSTHLVILEPRATALSIGLPGFPDAYIPDTMFLKFFQRRQAHLTSNIDVADFLSQWGTRSCGASCPLYEKSTEALDFACVLPHRGGGGDNYVPAASTSGHRWRTGNRCLNSVCPSNNISMYHTR